MKLFIKYLISVSLIITFVVTVTLSFDREIRKDIQVMTDISDEIEYYVLMGETETAFNTYKQLNDKWLTAKEKWSWMINHFIIKEIELSISNFGHYIDNSLENDAIVEKRKLMSLFESIKNLDTLDFHNIF